MADIKCSFCGKYSTHVAKIITGPGVTICSECIHLCNEGIRKNAFTRKTGISCSFCGKRSEQVDRVITGPGVNICTDCVKLCNDVLGIDTVIPKAQIPTNKPVEEPVDSGDEDLLEDICEDPDVLNEQENSLNDSAGEADQLKTILEDIDEPEKMEASIEDSLEKENDESVLQADDQETRVQYRALWRSLKNELEGISNDLCQTGKEGWHGNLLWGLIAYVDQDTALEKDRLDAFGSAIEQIGSSGHAQLRSIESTLMARAQAVQEAADYIHRRDYEGLRVLQHQVLGPAGDAIPPLIRASVYMMLWEHDPSYDPLPDLRSIPIDPDHEDLINACLRQIETVNLLNKLRHLCATSAKRDEEIIPVLGILNPDSIEGVCAALAVSVIQLKWKDSEAALNILQQTNKRDRPEFQNTFHYVEFYTLWQLGQMDRCYELFHDGQDLQYVSNRSVIDTALQVRRVISALDDRNSEAALSHLSRLSSHSIEDHAFILDVIRFIFWMLAHKLSRNAALLLNAIQVKGTTSNEVRQIHTFCLGLSAAQSQQYTKCSEAMGLLRGDEAAEEQILMCQLGILIKIQADLAVLTQKSDEEARLHWPSSQRSLQEDAAKLYVNPALKAYRFLIQGLVSYLTTDRLIDDAVIEQLMVAQQTITLMQHSDFLEKVISELAWRRRVIADFWVQLQNNDFKQSRMIFEKEMEPAFGDRVPHSIQLGMVLVDWDAGVETSLLLKRLAILETEARELNSEFLQQVKEYILDGDMIRHFTTLVKEEDFDGVISFVDKGKWAKSMPVPVAIALFHALYKKRRLEDARRFGEMIRSNTNLAQWVKDYGFFLLGYVQFDLEKYEGAAQAFGEVGVAELLSHDTNRYWAVSHFSHGLQLLEVDQKEKAFGAFRQSLNVTGIEHGNENLPPLFAHFGLKNIENRNGNQALMAFRLMEDSIKAVSNDTTDVLRNRLLAQMGQLLCRSLIEQGEERIPEGIDFLELIKGLDNDLFSEANRSELAFTFRSMAITQELRQGRMIKRPNRKKLLSFLEEQIKALEMLEEKRGEHDPVLMVLKGVIEVKIRNDGNIDQGIEYLTMAVRLGVQSRGLFALIEELSKAKETIQEGRAALLDFFDMYLTIGSIPSAIRGNLLRDDDIAALYELGRNYQASQIEVQKNVSSIAVMGSRFEHLKKMIDEVRTEGLEIDLEISEIMNKLAGYYQSMQKSEEKFLSSEKDILLRLAHKVARQS